MNSTLIAQKETILNLYVTNNESDEKKDLYDFLCNDYRGYKLICDIKDETEYSVAMEDNPIWELLIDKMDKITYDVNINNDISKDSFFMDLGEHNIFLIEETSEKCNELTSKHGYIFLNSQNIEANWKIYKEIRKGIPLKVTKSKLIPDNQRVNEWAKLDFISTPVTGIILFDNYILQDNNLQRVRDNLYPLLEIVLSKCRSSKDVTVTIITKPSEKCIKQIRGQILAHLKSKGYQNVEINIVKHHKRYYPADFEGLHSRYILTNYLRIKTEDSFNYFQPSGKINNESDIRIDFCLETRHKPLFEKDLEDLETYFKGIENNPNNPDHKCKVMFYPSKNNNLFNY